MLLPVASEPPTTSRMKPLAPGPLREGEGPAAPGPEVSIHKNVVLPVAPAPAPCLGYCPAPLRPGLGSSHPREGQQAALLGGKYLLLEALEGSSLHRCLHIPSQEELVCKVSNLIFFCILVSLS